MKGLVCHWGLRLHHVSYIIAVHSKLIYSILRNVQLHTVHLMQAVGSRLNEGSQVQELGCSNCPGTIIISNSLCSMDLAQYLLALAVILATKALASIIFILWSKHIFFRVKCFYSNQKLLRFLKYYLNCVTDATLI